MSDVQGAESISLWRCPDCGWVGFNEDGHCRQFDEHPDGPRIPLETVEYVSRECAERLADALDRFFYDLTFTAPEAIGMRVNQLGQRIEVSMKALGYPKKAGSHA